MSEHLNLLIIEKSEQDYASLVENLDRAGLSCVHGRVDDALELNGALSSGRWDVVLADCDEGGLSIRDILHAARKQQFEGPIILVSDSVAEAELLPLSQSGVYDCIPRHDARRMVLALTRVSGEVDQRKARSRAEHALAESEQRYRSLVDNAPVPIMVINQDEQVGLINRAARTLLGGGAEKDFLHRPMRDFIEGEYRARFEEVEGRVYREGAVRESTEMVLRKLTGEQVPVDMVGGCVDFHGRAAVQAVMIDTSERRKADLKLSQAATVFDATSEGIAITDGDGRFVAVNRAFTDITGYTEDDVLGQGISMLKSGRHDRMFYTTLLATLASAGQWSGEIWSRRKDGEVYPAWCNINSITATDGAATHHVAVFSDLTHTKRSQERVEYLTHHDPLTELPNRLLFQARLTHAIERAQQGHYELAVLFLDLDRFKQFNDHLGHPAGDALLKQFGKRLEKLTGAYETVARFGGDEFTIMLESINEPQDAAQTAQRILEGIREPYQLLGREVHMSASIGIALYPEDGDDVEHLTKNADAAMYRAKEQGRDNFQFYTSELTVDAFEHFFLESHLRHAVARGELELHYQPQVSLKAGIVIGGEALIRWRHPDMGLIMPSRFIPLAEESGLIVSLGEWLLHTACVHTRRWAEKGLLRGRIAVNISTQQLQRSDFLEVIERTLHETGCPPRYLQLEVTESYLMESTGPSMRTLKALRDLGLSLAIDDFGTGYSSLSYLKRLPVQKIKIDQSFVRDIPHDPDNEAIARAIISMGSSLGLDVIAEGVETYSQQDFLQQAGCDEIQGYLHGRPVPPEAFELLLGNRILTEAARAAGS